MIFLESSYRGFASVVIYIYIRTLAQKKSVLKTKVECGDGRVFLHLKRVLFLFGGAVVKMSRVIAERVTFGELVLVAFPCVDF